MKKFLQRIDVFKDANIKYTGPFTSFLFSLKSIFGITHTSVIFENLYSAYPNEDVFGCFELFKPSYFIKNPTLVEQIMIKDFSYFADRMKPLVHIDNPGDASMFLLSGNKWRAVRYKFSPLFTSGKLKYMYSSITQCGKTLIDVMDENVGKEVEMSEIMCLFAMDVIGSCAYGIEANLLQNPESDFRKVGKRLFQSSVLDGLRVMMLLAFPKLARAIGLSGFFRTDIVKYYCDIIIKNMEYRKANGIERNDFVQMLMQLKEKGKIEITVQDKNDDYLLLNKSQETYEVELTDDILLGGAFSFLTAGFHATAMSLTYLLYELARNPDVMKKIRDEIKEKIHSDKDMTYDELKNMTYLDNVIKEGMRLYPVAPFTTRLCTKDYTLPNGLKIATGSSILLPISSLQKDPAYFPDPLSFNPDRFETSPLPGTYFPFGEGPRMCIGMRFAQLEMKYAIAKLLKSYDFKLSERTKTPIEFKAREFLCTPKDGVMFYVTKIAQES